MKQANAIRGGKASQDILGCHFNSSYLMLECMHHNLNSSHFQFRRHIYRYVYNPCQIPPIIIHYHPHSTTDHSPPYQRPKFLSVPLSLPESNSYTSSLSISELEDDGALVIKTSRDVAAAGGGAVPARFGGVNVGRGLRGAVNVDARTGGDG